MPATPEVNITIIVAGTNEPSNVDFLAERMREGMRTAANVVVRKYRLRHMHIKHFTLDHYRRDFADDDDFPILRQAIQSAHAVVIASPVWNFSVPAHLKNLIDRMGSFALDPIGRSEGQLRSKPFFILLTGGAPMIAWKALMYITTLHITEALKYYDGTVVGRHFEPKCIVGHGTFGLVVDKRTATHETMRRHGKFLADIALHYAANGTLPVRTLLWHRIFSFLYRVGNRIMYPIGKRQ